MVVSNCLCILLTSVLISTLPPAISGVEYVHTIYINPSTRENSPSCLTSNSPLSPCRNLTWVFQQPHHSYTNYVLSGGTHFLTEPVPLFKDLSFLAFTGTNSTMNCTETNRTGLAFVNITNISFHGISFFNCAAVRNSTSKNFVNESISVFKVALYFYLCESINMSHINVSHSPNATGVVVYDTSGTNIISHSNFSHNSVSDDYPGGGGFYVEFTYCAPGQ